MSQDREEELEFDPGLDQSDDDGLDPTHSRGVRDDINFLDILDGDVENDRDDLRVGSSGLAGRRNGHARWPSPLTPPAHNALPTGPTTRINRTAHASRRPGNNINNTSNPIIISSDSSGSSADASPPPPQRPVPLSSQDSEDSIVALDEVDISEIGRRRFTAAEKGKGRAVVASSQPDVQVIMRGKKRKSGEIEGGKGNNKDEALEVDELFGEDDDYELNVEEVGQEEEEIEEAEEGVEYVDEFTCPVCFCNLTRPVSTLCGHILCGDCLHSSLLSAIGRQPNPLPTAAGGDPPHRHHHHHHPQAGPAPRPRKPRVTYTKAKAKLDPIHNPSPDSIDAQPPEWTLATLTAKLASEREREKGELEKVAERQFKEAGLPEENWEAAKIGMGMREDLGEVGEVKEVLKGVWRIPGGVVIEGECPVCRNPIPGGMGPYNSGIGSITPITAMLI